MQVCVMQKYPLGFLPRKEDALTLQMFIVEVCNSRGSYKVSRTGLNFGWRSVFAEWKYKAVCDHTRSCTQQVVPAHAQPACPKGQEICVVFVLLPIWGWKQGVKLMAPAAGFFPFQLEYLDQPQLRHCVMGQKTSLARQALVLMFQLEKAMALTEFSKGHFVQCQKCEMPAYQQNNKRRL